MLIEVLEKCSLCEAVDIIQIDSKNHIYKCDSCGYIFDNPRPKWPEIVKYYAQFDQYDNWLRDEIPRDLMWQRRLKLLNRYLDRTTYHSLLDIGTGTGQFLKYAKEYFEVNGTEISEKAIKIAKDKYGLEIYQGEIESIDIKKKFDIITLFHVLEHVPDAKRTIQRCNEFLNQNGVLVIAVPNDIYSIKSLIKRMISLFKTWKFKQTSKYGIPKIDLSVSEEVHLSHFTAKVLENLLRTNGFNIIGNTLDPYYAKTGMIKIVYDIFFISCLIFNKIFMLNIYDTILIIAKK